MNNLAYLFFVLKIKMVIISMKQRAQKLFVGTR